MRTAAQSQRAQFCGYLKVGAKLHSNACRISLKAFLTAPESWRPYFTDTPLIMLPVVLYGCDTWSHTLREEKVLKVFKNKVLIKIFGTKSDQITG